MNDMVIEQLLIFSSQFYTMNDATSSELYPARSITYICIRKTLNPELHLNRRKLSFDVWRCWHLKRVLGVIGAKLKESKMLSGLNRLTSAKGGYDGEAKLVP